MAKFKVNIFFIFSIVCMSLLVGYTWFNFLPLFRGSPEYDTIRNVAIFVTILLAVAIVLTFLQMRENE